MATLVAINWANKLAPLDPGYTMPTLLGCWLVTGLALSFLIVPPVPCKALGPVPPIGPGEILGVFCGLINSPQLACSLSASPAILTLCRVYVGFVLPVIESFLLIPLAGLLYLSYFIYRNASINVRRILCSEEDWLGAIAWVACVAKSYLMSIIILRTYI
jgi:hypothetical protein